MAAYVCNLCGTENLWAGEPFEREKPGCASCGANLRTRSLLYALSMELFGLPLSLPDFPRVKSYRGLGTSDSHQYAHRLAKVFDYRNTFYDREPRFDLGVSSEPADTYDFVLSSDVFEHVAPPAVEAFRNARNMLKATGVLVFTVPYEIADSAEHFPDLHEYGLVELGDRIALVNRTRTGDIKVSENLAFHLNGQGKSLEMRVYSQPMLKEILLEAGFTSVKTYAENYRPFGIVSAESWSLPIAARRGPAGCTIDAMKDVVGEWRDLKAAFDREGKRIAASPWRRIGRRLGFL